MNIDKRSFSEFFTECACFIFCGSVNRARGWLRSCTSTLVRLELQFKAHSQSPLKRTQRFTQSVLTDLNFEPRNLFLGGREF